MEVAQDIVEDLSEGDHIAFVTLDPYVGDF
jgi:hypothetical protein